MAENGNGRVFPMNVNDFRSATGVYLEIEPGLFLEYCTGNLHECNNGKARLVGKLTYDGIQRAKDICGAIRQLR